MVNIGIVGMGFMGTTHYQAAKGLDGGRVCAIVTRDPKKKRGDWSDVKGNLGTGGGQEDLSDVNVYDSLDELLADDQVQLVDICLPSPMHRDAAIRALEAGKDVLVEKPIALTTEDADAMVAASQRTGRRLLVGHVLRFFPEFAYLKQRVEAGDFGPLTALHLKRVIAQSNWRTNERASDNGGIVLDLLVHDADFVQFLAGMPNQVFASGVRNDFGHISYVAGQFVYENGPAVSVHCGGIAVPSIPFEHGFDAYFDRATVSFNSAGSLRIYTPGGEQEEAAVGKVDSFKDQLQYAVDCVAGRVDGSKLSAESARNSLRLCHLAAASVNQGSPVDV